MNLTPLQSPYIIYSQIFYQGIRLENSLAMSSSFGLSISFIEVKSLWAFRRFVPHSGDSDVNVYNFWERYNSRFVLWGSFHSLRLLNNAGLQDSLSIAVLHLNYYTVGFSNAQKLAKQKSL